MRASWLRLGDGRVETGWWGPPPDQAPTIVLLHEGLGCVALWRDIPNTLAAQTGCGVFAYSRLGYGQSDPTVLPRPLTYMQDEAADGLPELLHAAGIRQAVVVGHSDGGSIAAAYGGLRGTLPHRHGLTHASRPTLLPSFPSRHDRPEGSTQRHDHEARHVPIQAVDDGPDAPSLLGIVTIAAHFFVEDLNIASIRQIRETYREGDMRARMAKYHRDPDMAFYGWNDAWLDPGFRSFDLTAYLPRIAVPVLGLQGAADPYGTDAQLHIMQAHVRAPLTTMLIPDARHAPHLEAKDATLSAITRFVQEVLP